MAEVSPTEIFASENLQEEVHEAQPSEPHATTEITEETVVEPTLPIETTINAEANDIVETSKPETPTNGNTTHTTFFSNDTSFVEEQSSESANSVINADELIAYATERDVQRRSVLLTFPDRPMKEDAPSTLPDVDALLSDEQRQKFIKKIFRNSDIDYGIFIASFTKAQTWREAQLHLRELFVMNKLDILSPDVVEFTDAMHSRYEPELKTE
jgi:hypothetical protein